jgi:hypothetical protein
VLGFGYSAYKSITDGIDWTRDATKTIANAANDSYCWLKNGGYMVVKEGSYKYANNPTNKKSRRDFKLETGLKLRKNENAESFLIK